MSRPDGKKDPLGVEEARARLRTSYGMIDLEMATRTWAAGEAFSLADCAAAPALFYAKEAMPFGESHANVAARISPPDGATVLCAGPQGRRTVFRDVPEMIAIPPAITFEIIPPAMSAPQNPVRRTYEAAIRAAQTAPRRIEKPNGA
jgi:hypothetical protein